MERLFGHASQKATPQRAGKLSEESKRTFYVLLLHGPVPLTDMIKKEGGVIYVSRFIRMAQAVWVATQPSYQGVRTYRRRIARASAMVSSKKHKAGSLVGIRSEWKSTAASLLACDGTPTVEDRGQVVADDIPAANKFIAKQHVKWAAKFVEQYEAGQLDEREAALASKLAPKAKPKAKPKARERLCPHPHGGGSVPHSDAVVFFGDRGALAAAAIVKSTSGRRVVTNPADAHLLIVSDLTDMGVRAQFAAVVRGLRVGTPLWLQDPTVGPSVKYKPAVGLKLGIYLSDEFRSKHGDLAAEIMMSGTLYSTEKPGYTKLQPQLQKKPFPLSP